MNSRNDFPIIEGAQLFRNNELIYLNKSCELIAYGGKMHKHDFLEIAYVLSGEGAHCVGDLTYETIKGDLFIINYDIPHGFFSIPGKESPVVYNCVFRPEFLDLNLFSSVNFEDISTSFLVKSLSLDEVCPNSDFKLVGADQLEIEEIFSKMYREYNAQKNGYYDLLRAYLIELLVKIFRYSQKTLDNTISSSNRKLVEEAMSYLRKNYMSDITLKDLALQSFISINYFSQLFKKVSGINFTDYIQKLRIDEVCRLLRDTDMKILDIALQTGFKDIKFFYSVFKKHMGITPGYFRRNAHK
jgi:AraC-like DNA-binding protein